MLFILTGDIQTGKTTWLEARVRELEEADVPVRGVLAPGMWHDGEKVGIQNVLLPSRERVLLAKPVKRGQSPFDLGWDFDAAALDRVNAHLAELAKTADKKDVRPGLLVIDEVGPLELRRGGGLTAALKLLDAGPTPTWPHALVIVRSSLAEAIVERLRPIWGSVKLIGPNEAGASRLHEVLRGRLCPHCEK